MIKIIGTGRLTKDVEIKELEKSNILSFTLASGKDDEVQFMECNYLVSKDSKISQYLVKGTLISFAGNYFTEKWETKEGNKASRVVCRIEELSLESAQKKAE